MIFPPLMLVRSASVMWVGIVRFRLRINVDKDGTIAALQSWVLRELALDRRVAAPLVLVRRVHGNRYDDARGSRILQTQRAEFRYDTGQETPLTLVRAIRGRGLDNQGVNFDLANLISTARRIRWMLSSCSVHTCRAFTPHGLWPNNPRELGQEVPIGKVRWISAIIGA